MPASKAQQKAVAKYMRENYDEIKVRVAKGQRKRIKTFADASGQSVNGYIVEAVNEKIKRDGCGT